MSTIKSRGLADFTVEWTVPFEEEPHEDGTEAVLPNKLRHGSPWVLAFDEARQDELHE
jgi:hypothetical protein